MDTKKDIGAAVKNRLQDFKDTPDNLVWDTIEIELKKKKKRRAIIWFSGLGFALILSMLWLINPLNSSAHSTEHFENNTVEEHRSNTSNSNNIVNSNDQETPELKENSNALKNEQNLEKGTLDNRKESAQSDGTTKTVNTKNYHNPKNPLTPAQSPISAKASSKSNRTTGLTSLKTTHHDDHQISESNKSKNNTEDPSIKLTKSTSITANTRDEIKRKTVAQRDSMLAIRAQIRDSIKKQRQSKQLVSEDLKEETIKDSTILEDQSRWSITPQLSLSTYGAFNAKTTENFSVNYGVLASYRMTNYTYLRIGVRKLDLNQTIDGQEKRVEYLEFPLDIKYVPFKKKINPYITGGLSYFNLQKAVTSDTNNLDYKATVSFNLGLGVETRLFSTFYFNIEPNFNYQLKPFNQNNDINPFIFSINTGIEYRF
ncbi:porin family protein [uncultured Psychroserpens sp.]|uniref:porin family protein n=1 Tax=uncultured Psychroserpens sp. TaxID=255436 RepID=UPI002611555F|nr:porin family protein [uncultured Psychroserpens sp.]